MTGAGGWRRAADVAVAAAVAAAVACGTAAAEPPLQRSHAGIVLAAQDPDPDRYFDITITPAAEGLDAVQKALDLLLSTSPFSRQAIGRLKDAGRVVLVYDPNFPNSELTGLTIAAFFPEFFKHEGSGKDFVAVVGRFGVKWPADELAAVIAHELVGHGVQHLRGRLAHVRNVDLECEAYLYEEKAYQDVGIAKTSAEMIKFRKALEGHWCADFKRWMRSHAPDAVAYWDRLNPAVPEILEVYARYTHELRRTGVAGRAVANARAQRDAQTEDRVATLETAATPVSHYMLGQMYERGLGVAQDGARARGWYEKAAAAGHFDAQTALALLLYRGNAVDRDLAAARTWLTHAAEGGRSLAQALLGQMWINGEGGPRNMARGRSWLERAAAQGHAGAKKALAALDNADAASGG